MLGTLPASADPVACPAVLREDVQPVANETRDRIVTGAVTVIPFIGLGVAAWQVWNELLHWHDLVVFAVAT